MTKLVSSIEDLCLDTNLSFVVGKNVDTNAFIISTDSPASQTVFNRMKNGSYIKFWDVGETKKGIAVFGRLEGEMVIKVVTQTGSSVSLGDSLLTHSYYHKAYEFLNEYQTLQDILEYFQNPDGINNSVDFLLDNDTGTGSVLMIEPYDSRYILMSPTEKSKLAKLPYVVGLTRSIYVNTKTSMFYIKKDTTESYRLFRVHGRCTNGRQFDFDIAISSLTGGVDDVLTVYNRNRSIYMRIYISVRKSSDDESLYYQVCFERNDKNPEIAKDFTVDEMHIETQFPSHLKYDINQYPNYQDFLNWSDDFIEINPLFVMADTFATYIVIPASL